MHIINIINVTRFVCYGGASTGEPTDGATGEVCPRGFYCTEGSEVPSSCEPGFYGPELQMLACDLCPPGFVCPRHNMTAPEKCEPGELVVFPFCLLKCKNF